MVRVWLIGRNKSGERANVIEDDKSYHFQWWFVNSRKKILIYQILDDEKLWDF